MAIILLLISALCAVIFIYPYAIYPMILRRLGSRPTVVDPKFSPPISLLFCAYNEARNLPEKLENIRELKAAYPDLQVLAFDDASSDGSDEMLAAVPELLQLVRGGGRNGKAHGMKRLAAIATGDVLVFTDANVVLAPDALVNIASRYVDPTVGGVCGKLIYRGDRTTTAQVGSVYWRLEEYLKSEEARTGNVMGADGSIFSIRRTLYPEFPDTVLDDMTVSMATVFAGTRLIKADDVIAYENGVASRKEEFSRKVRIAARAFHTHLYLRPQLARMSGLDRFKYASRKLTRWFGAFFLFVGATTGLAGLWLLSPVVSIAVGVLAAALLLTGARQSGGPLSWIYEIVIALTATLYGVMKAMRGQTVVLWTPAKTR